VGELWASLCFEKENQVNMSEIAGEKSNSGEYMIARSLQTQRSPIRFHRWLDFLDFLD
jgi:hypothetical protein